MPEQGRNGGRDGVFRPQTGRQGIKNRASRHKKRRTAAKKIVAARFFSYLRKNPLNPDKQMETPPPTPPPPPATEAPVLDRRSADRQASARQASFLVRSCRT